VKKKEDAFMYWLKGITGANVKQAHKPVIVTTASMSGAKSSTTYRTGTSNMPMRPSINLV
jgi:hypothetical protein